MHRRDFLRNASCVAAVAAAGGSVTMTTQEPLLQKFKRRGFVVAFHQPVCNGAGELRYRVSVDHPDGFGGWSWGNSWQEAWQDVEKNSDHLLRGGIRITRV